MANIGWGKAGIYLCDLDVENSEWIQAPTPVENSTNLTPTKGSKQEAKLEGGENEDVRYGANNYALAYQIRSFCAWTIKCPRRATSSDLWSAWRMHFQRRKAARTCTRMMPLNRTTAAAW